MKAELQFWLHVLTRFVPGALIGIARRNQRLLDELIERNRRFSAVQERVLRNQADINRDFEQLETAEKPPQSNPYRPSAN